MRHRREVALAVSAGVLAVLTVFALLARRMDWVRSRPRPNVLLVTVDTLRRDRLGCYGSATARTPNIDRLASEGTLFENVTCPMPMTRPSHFSIFTSLYPRDHGVLNNALPLRGDLPVLPELFRRAGYRTAAFVGVTLFDPASGATRGFDVFDLPTDARSRPASDVIDHTLRWLKSMSFAEPFFLWVHLFDPHMPYAPPTEPREPSPPDLVKALPHANWPSLLTLAEQSGGDLPAAAYRRALALYDGEVEYADHWLGLLFDGLRSGGVLDRTLVAFTADHGECFEHGIFFDHSDCLYDAGVVVPLIFRLPGRVPAGARQSAVADNLDLAPTALALAGREVPRSFLGRNLFSSRATAARIGFLQHPFYSKRAIALRAARLARMRSVMGSPSRPLVMNEQQAGLRNARWKYLRTGNQEELYDLGRDPAELENVASQQSEVTNELRQILQRWIAAHPLRFSGDGEAEGEFLETLRALGYVQ